MVELPGSTAAVNREGWRALAAWQSWLLVKGWLESWWQGAALAAGGGRPAVLPVDSRVVPCAAGRR